MGVRKVFVVLAALVAAVVGAGPALADGAPSAADLHVAQTLGERELTVVIRRAEPVPGPLRVEVVTHAGTAPGTLVLRAAATGASTSDEPSTPSEATLALGERPGPYAATLRVDRTGPWELAVDDGERVARIPFIVPERVVSAWEKAAYGGFVGAGLFMLVTVVVAVRVRRGWVALAPAGAVVAALAVGMTAALLSASLPPPVPPGLLTDPTGGAPEARLSTVDYSRPPVNLLVRADGDGVGRPLDLRIGLTDTGSGRPADDLLVRDNALIHLVVVGPTGELWHLHPIRTAPGEYTARLTPPAPGEYALAAELSRRGGGVQLLRSEFTVGAPGTDYRPAPGPGPRDIEGTTVTVDVSGLTTQAASAVTARFGDTADLQPWLGMAGHLIIVGPLSTSAADAPVWAHVHAMIPASMGRPDETVASFGPEVSFAYRFPLPGRYRLWVQAERDYRVLTVPVEVVVR
ncbi:hypothetical protein [Actinokineospora fastidiosa]|nr:hypothetical protein [Actinokineospora fastidiosa]